LGKILGDLELKRLVQAEHETGALVRRDDVCGRSREPSPFGPVGTTSEPADPASSEFSRYSSPERPWPAKPTMPRTGENRLPSDRSERGQART